METIYTVEQLLTSNLGDINKYDYKDFSDFYYCLCDTAGEYGMLIDVDVNSLEDFFNLLEETK